MAKFGANNTVQHRAGFVFGIITHLVAGFAFLENLFAIFGQGHINGRGCGCGRFGGRRRFGCGHLHCFSLCCGFIGALFLGGHIQNRGAHGDFHAVLAIAHARFGVPEMLFRGLTVVDDKPVRIGHFNIEEVFVRQNEIIINQIVGIQNIGHDGIGIIHRHGLRIAKRHRAVHVIPRCRQVGPIAANGFQRIFMIERIHAAGQFWPVVHAFGKITVAHGAMFGKYLFARHHIARTSRQAIAIGRNIQVPRGNFFGQGRPAKAHFIGKSRGRSHQRGHGCA